MTHINTVFIFNCSSLRLDDPLGSWLCGISIACRFRQRLVCEAVFNSGALNWYPTMFSQTVAMVGVTRIRQCRQHWFLGLVPPRDDHWYTMCWTLVSSNLGQHRCSIDITG